MDRGFRLFLIMVVSASLLSATAGMMNLYDNISGTPSESDIIGDWKLSRYYEYTYDGESVYVPDAYKDDDSGLSITLSDNVIEGIYRGMDFKGAMEGRLFQSSFSCSDTDYHIIGYMDEKTVLHLGVLSNRSGKVSSSMSVYNKDGSRTVYDDNVKTIIGDWSVDCSTDYGSSERTVSLEVEDQLFSIIRGNIGYESGKDLVFSGFVTPMEWGVLRYGCIIDSDGNIWELFTTRGQITLMNGSSEFLMTKDGGYHCSYPIDDLKGTVGSDGEGNTIEISEQSDNIIRGEVRANGSDYVLEGNIIADGDTLASVMLAHGTDIYSGYLLSSGDSVTVVVLKGDEAINLKLNTGGSP